MKNSITTTKTLITCMFLLLSASAVQNEVTEQDFDNPEFAPGEILVKFRDELDFQLYEGTGVIQTNNASINLLNARFGAIEMGKVLKTAKKPDASGMIMIKGKKAKVPNLTNIYRIMFGKDADILPIIGEYKTVSDVEYVEPNYYRYTQATIPNDPSYYKQWHLPAIDAPSAWDVTTGSSDVVIGIIDTGVKWNHPDLADNIWINVGEVEGDGIDNDGNGFIDDVRGWDFVTVGPSEVYAGEDPGPPDNDPMDFHGHGTHVSGIAGSVGNNGIGVTGVNWNVSLMALRAGYKSSTGGGLLQISDVADALVYAADNGAHVVNMSFGGYFVSQIERLAIDYCADSGVLLVAAAGNEETNEPLYPAGFKNVLAVASSYTSNHRSTFSNYGVWIDVTAPGSNIYSTLVDGGYGYMWGTSMASPVAAGVAGLVRSAYPTWTADRIALQLRSTANNINADNPDFVNLLGAGLVAADQAVTVTTPPVKLGVVSLWAEEVDGSSDGWLDPGETIELRPSVRNFGLAQAGISVSLTTSDPYVSILDNASFVGNMDENRIAATWDDPLSIVIASYTPQDHILWLSLEISTDDNGVVATDIAPLRLNPILGSLASIAQHTTTIDYREPQVLAKPGGEMTILYRSDGFTENQVYARSTNPSGDWMPAVCISEPSEANYARVHHGAVADDGSVHVVFMGVFGLWDAELFYTTQDPTDGTWSIPVQLTIDAVIYDSDIYGTEAPSTIAIDPQGHPHVVWADYRSGNAELFYMYHDGFAWSTEAVIGSPPAEPVTLNLIFDSLGIGYLLWNQADNTIYMMKLTGSTWGPPTYVTTTSYIKNLSVTLDSTDSVHMVYSAPNADDVSYRQYDGTTWSSTEVIMLDTYVYDVPLIATDPGDLLHVVKLAQPGFLAGEGAIQIYETVYDGAAWSSLVPITFDRAGTPYQLGLDFAIDQSGARLLAGMLTQEDVFFLSSDRDPARLPSRPSVVDDGMTTTDPFSLSASWSSSHPSGIAEYRYAIGTAPGEGDLRYWTSIGMSTSLTADLTGTPLIPGQAYYVSVYAIGNNGYFSPIGVSDGIALAYVSLLTSIPGDEWGGPGTTVNIPVGVDDTTGLGITSVSLTVTYDDGILTATSASTTGTIAEAWGAPAYSVTPGQIVVDMSSGTPLAGSGTLVDISFDVDPAATCGSTSALTLANVEFNAGAVNADLQDGVFTVARYGDVTFNCVPSPFDSAWILEYSVGKREFTELQLIVGDVSCNGTASPYDSSLILQYSVGKITQFPCEEDGESFLAYRKIDIDTAQASSAGAPANVAGGKADKVQKKVTVSIPTDAAGESGHIVTVPVNVSDVTGKGVVSVWLAVTYDDSLLTATGASTTGTIAESWGEPTYNVTPGRITIAMASFEPLAGSGALLNINFQVSDTAAIGSKSHLRFGLVEFSEDAIPMTAARGLLKVTAPMGDGR